MAVVYLKSIDDARLAPYWSLKQTNDTRWAGQFVVEGDKLVERLLASDFEIESLLVAKRHLPAFSAAAERAPLLVVDDARIEAIVGFNFHRGVLACARRRRQQSLEPLVGQRQARLTLVVCPDVQNPENLGAILRLAAAFAVDGVALGPGCCDPFSRRVLRVSMGAALKVPIVEADDLAEQLAAARTRHGLRLCAAVTDPAAQPFETYTRPPRLALLLGSEGHGLSNEWLAQCDQAVTIPIGTDVDSLNVAVAAGILLYRLAR
jgi:tRNA G18 (ribose-2'-O)-methylase SpoU